MAREFLPALRSRLGLTAKQVETETKTYVVRDAFGSVPYGMTLGMQDRAADWPLEKVVREAYERSVWTFRCVEAISSHQSRLPMFVRQGEQTVDDYPLYRLWNKRSNPHERAREFRERLSANVLLSKRGAFVEVTRSRANRVARYDLLPPERMRPIPDMRGNYVEKWEFTERNGRIREIGVEDVRWVRKPHPTDPFSGVTPLEAAGISVDLDLMARIYNVSFMQNDGRPGGVLAVDSEGLSEQEMDRIERRFQPGVEHAGRMSVIGVGKDGAIYIDTSTRPRDMAYGETSSNAKDEILAAFGVPESVLGNASGRTFNNAEQEEYNFWEHTMLPHLEMVASAFDEDSEDNLETFIDTSGVEALEFPRRKRREEARSEFEAGLISIDEYRDASDREAYDNAHSRALWISSNKVPVPARPADMAELGMEPPTEPGAPVDEFGQPINEGDAAAAGGTAAEAVAEARGELGDTGGQAEVASPDAATAADVVAEALERKDASAAGAVEIDPGEDELRAGELAVSAALTALLARQAGVVNARLASPKVRKGTRFWTPESDEDTRGGQDALDPAKVVDVEKWLREAQDTLLPIVQDAAAGSGATLLAAMAAAGLIVGAPEHPDAWLRVAGQAAASATLAAVTVAGEALATFTGEVAELVGSAAADADDVEAVKSAVSAFYNTKSGPFARSVGFAVAQIATAASREAAVDLLAPAPDSGTSVIGDVTVMRHWRTRKDAQVRPEHAAIEGQRRELGEPFDVGEAQLRFPGDPLGPPHLVYGCRCRLSYSVAGSGVFLPPPGLVT